MNRYFRNIFAILTLLILGAAFFTPGGLSLLVAIGWVMTGAMCTAFICTVGYFGVIRWIDYYKASRGSMGTWTPTGNGGR